MSEFTCTQTGELCELSGLCKLKTDQAKALVENWSSMSRQEHEAYLEGPGINQYTFVDGKPVPLSKEEAKRRREELSHSADYAADIGELDAHLANESSLVFPEDPNSPEAAHDIYDQLTQTICLYGTARAVESILGLGEGEREEAIATLFLWANSPGSISDAR